MQRNSAELPKPSRANESPTGELLKIYVHSWTLQIQGARTQGGAARPAFSKPHVSSLCGRLCEFAIVEQLCLGRAGEARRPRSGCFACKALKIYHLGSLPAGFPGPPEPVLPLMLHVPPNASPSTHALCHSDTRTVVTVICHQRGGSLQSALPEQKAQRATLGDRAQKSLPPRATFSWRKQAAGQGWAAVGLRS